MKEKICKICDRELKPDHPRRKYHVGKCQKTARYKSTRRYVLKNKERWKIYHREYGRIRRAKMQEKKLQEAQNETTT